MGKNSPKATAASLGDKKKMAEAHLQMLSTNG